MSNSNWIKKAKRIAAKRGAALVPVAVQGVLFVPEFVKRAASLGLTEIKNVPALPAPQVGDPGMLEIRNRARHAAVRTALPGQRVVGRLQTAAAQAPSSAPIEIDATTFVTSFSEARAAGRTQLTMREFERLLALPYEPVKQQVQ